MIHQSRRSLKRVAQISRQPTSRPAVPEVRWQAGGPPPTADAVRLAEAFLWSVQHRSPALSLCLAGVGPENLIVRRWLCLLPSSGGNSGQSRPTPDGCGGRHGGIVGVDLPVGEAREDLLQRDPAFGA